MCLLQFLSTIDNEHSERKSNQVGKRCVEHQLLLPFKKMTKLLLLSHASKLILTLANNAAVAPNSSSLNQMILAKTASNSLRLLVVTCQEDFRHEGPHWKQDGWCSTSPHVPTHISWGHASRQSQVIKLMEVLQHHLPMKSVSLQGSSMVFPQQGRKKQGEAKKAHQNGVAAVVI